MFAAVEHDTLQELQEAIAGTYWQAGLRSETSLIVRSSRLAAPKRGSPEYCGLVRATIADRDPFEVLEDLDRMSRSASTRIRTTSTSGTAQRSSPARMTY